jgi:polygalacturonase
MRYYTKATLILLLLLIDSAWLYSQVSIPGAYGDGTHNDTQVIQHFLDSISAKGGTINFAHGKYLIGVLNISGNNITFNVDSTATILLSTDSTVYTSHPKGAITASGCNYLTISGKGKIDGQGSKWWSAYNSNNGIYRPTIFQLSKCNHVIVKDITLTNSPKFHLPMSACYDVDISNITITATYPSPNTDGIDIGECHHVRVTGCYIDNGDDDITTNGSGSASGWSASASDIIIKHCTFMHGHGCSIGSYTQGGVDSILVDSCSFNGTDFGMRLKTDRTRGGEVHNVTYSNCTITNIVKYPIYLTHYYSNGTTPPSQTDPAQPITSTTPNYHDIYLKNVTVTNCAYAGLIVGVPEQPMKNIIFQNVNISAKKGLELRNATLYADTTLITVTTKPRIIYEVNGFVLNSPTRVDNNEKLIFENFRLAQNYPNPFNPSTLITYQLQSDSKVTLKVYNTLGKEVATIVDERQMAGQHNVNFNASEMPSGVYYYKLQAGSFSETKKMLLLK